MRRDPQGEVFERPLPRGYLAGFVFLFVPALLLALASGEVATTAARYADRLPWVDGWTFSLVVHGGCIAAAGLVSLASVGWAGRRYGRAVITPDHVVVTPIRRGLRPIVVPRDDIVRLHETEHGLVIDAPVVRGGLRARLLPTLIPVTDADLARAHELLEPSRRVARPVASASSGRPSTLTAVAVAVPLWLLIGVSLWSENLDARGTVVTSTTAGALLVLGWIASAVERRRVHAGTDTVSVGSLCGAWTTVARVWTWGAWFALELQDGRRQHARIGVEAAARLGALARASLDALRRDETSLAFSSRRPPWVARRRAAFAALVALLTTVYVGAGPVAAHVREGCLGVFDHHGYRLRLVYRARGGAPCLVVVVDPGAGPVGVRAGGWRALTFEDQRVGDGPRDGPPVWVDVQAGTARWGDRTFALPTDATVVHVHADGVTTSTRPLPVPSLPPIGAGTLPPPRTETLNVGLELLEGWFPGCEDPVLRDVLDGRTTTRCFSCPTSDGGYFCTQVRRGAVRALLLVDPGPEGWRPGGACRACEVARSSPGFHLRATSGGVFDRSAPPPSLEQVLETQRLLRQNVPVKNTPLGRLAWTPR